MADDRDLGFVDEEDFHVSRCCFSFSGLACYPLLGDLDGSIFLRRQNFKHRIQQIVDPTPVLGRNGEHLFNPQPMKLVNDVRLLFGVGFVDREKERTSGLAQQANQFEIGAREFGAAVNHHDDRGGLIERYSRLAEDFRRDEVFFFWEDAASIDNADAPAAPLRIAVKPVAGDAGLVANDGAARANDAVEQRGLAYVRSAHDGQRRNAGCGGGESAGRVVRRLSQNEFLKCGESRPRLSLGLKAQRRSAVTARNSYYRASCGFKFPTRVSRKAQSPLLQRQGRFSLSVLRAGRSSRAHASGV